MHFDRDRGTQLSVSVTSGDSLPGQKLAELELENAGEVSPEPGRER